MYVCVCKALTEGDLESLVAAVGPDFETIQECCGVSTDCGSCLSKATRVVEEAASAGGARELAAARSS